jgi:hypothetical protein
MRIRRRRYVPIKNLLLIGLILAPFSFAGYMAYHVGEIYRGLAAFSYEIEPDPSEFLPADYTRMAEMIVEYDRLFEANHLPLNFTAGCVYTNLNFTNVSYYTYSDNGALWTGIAMAGLVFKYLAGVHEENTMIQQDALRVIRRMVHGMSMLMIVPNGGLGPEYSGILARGWAGPEHQTLAPMYFQPNDRHFNGTGNYSNYRWRGYTSNDEYGGYYMGLALALKYIPDDYVQTTVHLIVDQLCNYMIKTNFLGISGTGNPTGVNQKAKFGSGAFWVLTLLKMGAICYPEKYEQRYYHYLAENWYYMMANEGGDQETISNYFAYNFGHAVVFAYLTLEDRSSNIWHRFYTGYLNSLRSYTATHRNAWFNVIYLALLDDPTSEPIVARDIEDQLMRFDINHFPDRLYGIQPIPDDWPKVSTMNQWYDYLYNDPKGQFYRVFLPEVQFDEDYYLKPLNPEYRRTGNFMWEHNPYQADGNYVNPRYEGSGSSFFVPYWIARAIGVIQPSGVRIL